MCHVLGNTMYSPITTLQVPSKKASYDSHLVRLRKIKEVSAETTEA